MILIVQYWSSDSLTLDAGEMVGKVCTEAILLLEAQGYVFTWVDMIAMQDVLAWIHSNCLNPNWCAAFTALEIHLEYKISVILYTRALFLSLPLLFVHTSSAMEKFYDKQAMFPFDCLSSEPLKSISRNRLHFVLCIKMPEITHSHIYITYIY